MANWDNLKKSVASIIKENNNGEITGDILQTTLLNIISTIGENATFAGIAEPNTRPGVPDGSVFYLASAIGSYANFSALDNSVPAITKPNTILIITNQYSGDKQKWLSYKLLDIEGNTFGGFVTKNDRPSTLSTATAIFYLAADAGTYTYFNNIELASGEAAILEKENGVWQKKGISLATYEEFTKLYEYKVSNEKHNIAIENNTNLFIPYNGGTTIGRALEVKDGAFIVRDNIGGAILYTYTNIQITKTYYLKSSWRSVDSGYPLVIFCNNSNDVIGYEYMNTRNLENIASFIKLSIPEGTTKIYVNSRYDTDRYLSGLFECIIYSKDQLLNYSGCSERAINLFDSSLVKDNIAVAIDTTGCRILRIEGYSMVIIPIEENTTYTLANYNCASKNVAIFNNNFEITGYKNADVTMSSKITKAEGTWASDDSPITISTDYGDKYIAFNVQRANDNYYKLLCTRLMLCRADDYTGAFIQNTEITFARKLFSHNILTKVPIKILYGMYFDEQGSMVNNAGSCLGELRVSPGQAFLIKAIPSGARYIHECDINGDIIKSYNITDTTQSYKKDIIIIASAHTAILKISSSIYHGEFEVYSLGQNTNKEISMLLIGNSLTQDAMSYVPFLIKSIAPEISFRFYMWYNGGKTLQEQYNDYFLTGAPCQIFSIAENTAKWTNMTNSVTIDDILNNYSFDTICLQEYFNYKETYGASDIAVYNNIVNFIEDRYTQPFKLITLFHQPKRDRSTPIYNLTLEGIKRILSDTPTDDLLAPGIAIYKALSTELNSLGDLGGLTPDGTHSQEGLPCLMQAYTILIWIFQKLGICKSIINNKSYISDINYTTLNVPGPNLGSGVIVGTTAENRLAQNIAVEAVKTAKKLL